MTQTVLPDQGSPKTASAPTPETAAPATQPTADNKVIESPTPAESPANDQSPELTLPDDAPLDSAHLDGLKKFSAENQVSGELAKKLLARDIDMAKARAAADAEAQAREVKGWEEKLTADKEFGGPKLKAADLTATSVIDRFLPELKAQILESGIARNPDVFRLLYRIGTAMAEGAPVRGSPPLPQPKPKSTGEKFFAASMGPAKAET